jgi:hypothetical protein
MVNLNELRQKNIITKLEKVEKDKYVFFHFNNYNIDLKSAEEFLKLKNSKYVVIAGYYAVLNVTLWYFSKFFNLKISEKDTGVHKNCLIVLEEYIKDNKLKEKIIYLLNQAKKEFTSFTFFKKKPEETLPIFLKISSEKRKRYTYYSSERKTLKEDESLNEAKLFIKNIVIPYIKIIEELK